MRLLKYFFLIFLFIPIYVHAKYGYEVVSGDLNTVGSVVKIGDEEFYVIGKEDETHIKLFAKYNLGVGNEFDPPTNKQEITATGWVVEDTCGNGQMESGNPHCPGSIIGEPNDYINNYVIYLNTLKVKVTGKSITIDELESLGCNSTTYKCLDAPEWVYSTSYWTDSFLNVENNLRWEVYQSGSLFIDGFSDYFGVRPVIVLDSTYEYVDPTVDPDPPIENNEPKEEKYENPPTGTFLPILLLIVLISGSGLIIFNSKRKELFKKL